jgi:F-type H+-transporting ATPase subunit delta
LIGGGLARRYVQSLFEVAQEKDVLDTISGDLKLLDDTLMNSPELTSFLNDPSTPKRAKKVAIEGLFTEISEFSLNFVRVVIDKNRTEILSEAYRIFQDMIDTAKGILNGTIQSVIKLDDKLMDEIRKSLEKRFNKKLILDNRITPELIGGLKIQVGNMVIDASVKSRLENLKEILAG